MIEFIEIRSDTEDWQVDLSSFFLEKNYGMRFPSLS